MREIKNSGVEWIGEIPVEWDIIKIKQLPDRSIDNSFVDGDWIESPDISDEGIRYLTTGNIGDGKYKKQGNGFVTLEVFQNLNCKYAYPGDLVISRLNAPYGRSCILPDDYSEYVLAVDNVILRTNNDKKYICYITQCDGYQKSVEDNAKGTTMKRISRTNLGNVLLPFPPLTEQHRIADFLDEKCAKIDAVIEKQKQVIEKLKEYKLSVITEAIMESAKNDLKMKKLGDHISVLTDYHANGSYEVLREHVELLDNPDYALMVRTTNLERNDFIDNVVYINKIAYDFLNKSKVYGEEIIINKIGSAGKVYYMPNLNRPVSLAMNQFLLRFDDKCYTRYIYYYLHTKYAEEQIAQRVKGAVTLTITKEAVRSIPLLLPDINEQTKIANYLDNQCDEINSAIHKKQSIIEKLTEYKKSLIYEVVTGKKEV